MAVVRAGGAAQAGRWILDASSGRLLRRVAKGSVAAFDWSPDGRRLVFATTSYRGENGRVSGGNLYVVRAAGGPTRLFVRTRGVGAVNPVWSPDGRSIAWVQMRFTAGDVAFRVIPTLWRRSASGGPARRLAILRSPSVEEGYHSVPDLAWQPLPRR
jgi:Tol biopolymer transport system component